MIQITPYRVRRDYDNETGFFIVNAEGWGLGFQIKIGSFVYGISVCLNQKKEKKDTGVLVLQIALVLIVVGWLYAMLTIPTEANVPYRVNNQCYVTYDKEGDWILWDVKPVNLNGLWMPPENSDFNCESISSDAARILIK